MAHTRHPCAERGRGGGIVGSDGEVTVRKFQVQASAQASCQRRACVHTMRHERRTINCASMLPSTRVPIGSVLLQNAPAVFTACQVVVRATTRCGRPRNARDLPQLGVRPHAHPPSLAHNTRPSGCSDEQSRTRRKAEEQCRTPTHVAPSRVFLEPRNRPSQSASVCHNPRVSATVAPSPPARHTAGFACQSVGHLPNYRPSAAAP